MPGRPTTLAYGRAGACVLAAGAAGLVGRLLFFFIFFVFVFVVVVSFLGGRGGGRGAGSSRLFYLPFLRPHLLGDDWTY